MASPAPTRDYAINFTTLSEHPSGDLSSRDPQNCEINCTTVSGLVSSFIRNSLAPNTLRAYASDVETFRQWGGRVPASPELVAEFLAAHARSHASSTLSRYLAAISKVHRVRSLPDPTTSELVKATLRGIRRTRSDHGNQGGAAPLMRCDLYKVLDAFGSSLVDHRDRALLLFGFAGAFRRSELVALNVDDLKASKHGLVVMLRCSKTDQLSKGHEIGIPHSLAQHCPVAALQQWLRDSRISAGPLFRSLNRGGRVSEKRLSGEAVSLIIRQRLAAVGIESNGYSSHSLRSGYATSAAIAGAPLWKIRAQTRHATVEGVSRYVKIGAMLNEEKAVEVL